MDIDKTLTTENPDESIEKKISSDADTGDKKLTLVKQIEKETGINYWGSKDPEYLEKQKKYLQEYKKGYFEDRYARLTFTMEPELKAMYLALTTLNKMTQIELLRMMLEKEVKNYDPEEYERAYRKVSKEKINTRLNVRNVKEDQIETALKTAEKYFKLDPRTIDKNEKIKYIKKESDKGKVSVSVLCEALDISRALYYQALRKEKKSDENKNSKQKK